MIVKTREGFRVVRPRPDRSDLVGTYGSFAEAIAQVRAGEAIRRGAREKR